MDLITIVNIARIVGIEQKRDSAYAWFQWLAEHLAEKERRTEIGAYRKYRNWKP